MKWTNCDTNVVEWANIRKFSTLDDNDSSQTLSFDEVLVDTIFGYTMLYSHKEKAGISFEIATEKTRLFLSMLLLSGCYRLPAPDTFA